MSCCSSSTLPQNWTSVYSYHLIALLQLHWQVPFEYVCISPLDHVLLLFDAVSFVCYMAFVSDMVHVILLVIEVLSSAGVPIVVFHPGRERLKRQARRQKVYL